MRTRRNILSVSFQIAAAASLVAQERMEDQSAEYSAPRLFLAILWENQIETSDHVCALGSGSNFEL